MLNLYHISPLCRSSVLATGTSAGFVDWSSTAKWDCTIRVVVNFRNPNIQPFFGLPLLSMFVLQLRTSHNVVGILNMLAILSELSRKLLDELIDLKRRVTVLSYFPMLCFLNFRKPNFQRVFWLPLLSILVL